MSASQMQRRPCAKCQEETLQVATHCLTCGHINQPIKVRRTKRGRETDCATILILDFEDGRNMLFGDWA